MIIASYVTKASIVDGNSRLLGICTLDDQTEKERSDIYFKNMSTTQRMESWSPGVFSQQSIYFYNTVSLCVMKMRNFIICTHLQISLGKST
jgi:hypothetical protein